MSKVKIRVVKTCLALILSCVLVIGADTGIRVTTWTTTVGWSNSVDFVTQTISDGTGSSTTTKTTPHVPGKNMFFSVSEKDVFTRDGQTNLVRTTESDGSQDMELPGLLPRWQGSGRI